jgi:SAM-dependent methyltransferase
VNDLSDSIPRIDAYRTLISSEFFRKIEQYSQAFLDSNKSVLEEYAAKWVPDPLHQWSRQWEYPFVLSRIESAIGTRNVGVSILDAGSGITFFPYYIMSRFRFAKLYCCDIDSGLSAPYEAINASAEKQVHFSVRPLQDTGFASEMFDIVYCISVLEHTDNYPAIIDEFVRILKGGGTLIVTFDISLAGNGDVDPEGAAQLLSSLVSQFEPDNRSTSDLGLLLSQPDILTTRFAYNLNPALMPWEPPTVFDQFKSVLKGQGLISYPRSYTVYCLSLTKRLK